MSTNYSSVDHLLQKKKMPISAGHTKESEPVLSRMDNFEIQEVVENEPNPEITNHVDVRPETIKITQDLKKIGLQEVDSASFPSYQNIKLPLSDEKVYNGLHAPITSSLRWLATFALFLLTQGHLRLKQVHGKVVRVVKR